MNGIFVYLFYLCLTFEICCPRLSIKHIDHTENVPHNILRMYMIEELKKNTVAAVNYLQMIVKMTSVFKMMYIFISFKIQFTYLIYEH